MMMLLCGVHVSYFFLGILGKRFDFLLLELAYEMSFSWNQRLETPSCCNLFFSLVSKVTPPLFPQSLVASLRTLYSLVLFQPTCESSLCLLPISHGLSLRPCQPHLQPAFVPSQRQSVSLLIVAALFCSLSLAPSFNCGSPKFSTEL